MSGAYVQQTPAGIASTASVATGNFPSAVTAGNLIHAVCAVVSGITCPSPPTDTLGNTYILIGSCTESGTGDSLYHWYAKNVSGGTNALSITASGAGSIGLAGAEFSGLDINIPLNGHSELGSNPGTSGPDVITSGFATCTIAPALLVGLGFDIQGAIENAGTTPIAYTGQTPTFNNWGGSGANNGRWETARVTSTGSYPATFQDTGFDRHNALIAIFIEQLTAPVVTVQPQPQVSAVNGQVTFSLSGVASAGSLSYQWKINTGGGFVNIGTNAATLSLYALQLYNAGSVKCTLTDSNGSVDSNTVSLIVLARADQVPRRRLRRGGGMTFGTDTKEWW